MILLNDNKLKIAETDIQCYVVLTEGNYISPWDAKINKVTTILDGKYAYFGYYSAKYKEELQLFEDTLKGENRVIVKAVIPKGSKYYVGYRNYSFTVSKEHISITTFCSDNLIIKNNGR